MLGALGACAARGVPGAGAAAALGVRGCSSRVAQPPGLRSGARRLTHSDARSGTHTPPHTCGDPGEGFRSLSRAPAEAFETGSQGASGQEGGSLLRSTRPLGHSPPPCPPGPPPSLLGRPSALRAHARAHTHSSTCPPLGPVTALQSPAPCWAPTPHPSTLGPFPDAASGLPAPGGAQRGWTAGWGRGGLSGPGCLRVTGAPGWLPAAPARVGPPGSPLCLPVCVPLWELGRLPLPAGESRDRAGASGRAGRGHGGGSCLH